MAHEHDKDAPLPDTVLRVRALESLLADKGIINPQSIDALVDTFENKVGPHIGANIVARAWIDPEYKQRLLTDTNAAIEEMNARGIEGAHVVAVENTPTRHNVVVCTLCSCYPWALLGLPPTWYKSAPYRARVVREPREVLRDFGTELPEDVEIRVWDSSAEIRYLVIPERPAGSEGLSQEELAALVTRDAMVGTRKVELPESQG